MRFQLQRVNGKLARVALKSEMGQRTLSLPAVAVSALRLEEQRKQEARALAGVRWVESAYVFTSTIGTPLPGSTVSNRFRKHLARAGMPHMRFHNLRHGTASLLIAGGESLRTVMEVLGHSEISTTANFYTHISAEVKREAANWLQAMLAEPADTRIGAAS